MNQSWAEKNRLNPNRIIPAWGELTQNKKCIAIFLLILVQSVWSAKAEERILDYCESPFLSDPLSFPPLIPPSSSYSLEFLQVVIRHGDRTPEALLDDPLFTEPNPEWKCDLNSLSIPGHSSQSPNPNRLFRIKFQEGKQYLKGNCNLGQLTDRGFLQHSKLGKSLREFYNSSTLFRHLSGVKVRSTNVYRTIQSVQALLNGLYPQSKDSMEVVAIETRDKEREDMTPYSFCPAWKVEMNKVYSSPDWINYHNNLSSYFNFTNDLKALFNVSNVPDYYALFDHYVSRLCHGFPLPSKVDMKAFRKMEEIESWEWNASIYPKILGKLGMGNFISTLLTNLVEYAEGKSNETRVRIFSGHDTTIAPLLGALELFDGTWPPYASHLQIELWSNARGKFLVGMKYNGKALFLSKCNSYYCPLYTLKKWWGSLVPTTSECQG